MEDIQKTDTGVGNFIKYIHTVNKGLLSFSNDIFLIEFNVAGTNYIEDIESLESELSEETHLNFYRESNNVFDKNAILIKYNNKKIGYVPRVYGWR